MAACFVTLARDHGTCLAMTSHNGGGALGAPDLRGPSRGAPPQADCFRHAPARYLTASYSM